MEAREASNDTFRSAWALMSLAVIVDVASACACVVAAVAVVVVVVVVWIIYQSCEPSRQTSEGGRQWHSFPRTTEDSFLALRQICNCDPDP